MSHDQTVQPGPVNGGLEQDAHQDEGRRFTFLIVDNNSGVIVLDTQTRHIFWQYHPPARGYPNGPVDVVDIGMDDAAGGGGVVLVITLADAYDTEYVEVFYLGAADRHDQWEAELVYSQELFFAHDESAARFTHVLRRAQCALLFATRGRRIVLVDWENRRVACVFTVSSLSEA
ncbi:hypothetical protein DFH11DRAFT_1620934 [Phellopilus nigrolimitatus]|nr:hypothetical protein DFH11DRAFT_1620934 [Phellopilus nigrolimitatus]